MNYCGAPDAGGSQVQCFVRLGPGDVARPARQPSRLDAQTRWHMDD